MTKENKKQKSLFRKIVIILAFLLLLGLVIGAVSYLITLKEAFRADNEWHIKNMTNRKAQTEQIR